MGLVDMLPLHYYLASLSTGGDTIVGELRHLEGSLLNALFMLTTSLEGEYYDYTICWEWRFERLNDHGERRSNPGSLPQKHTS